MTQVQRRRWLAVLGMPFLVGGAAGHAFAPGPTARRYAWRPSPWVQRQLASFQAPHLYAAALLVTGRRVDEAVYIRVLGLSSLGIAATHVAAIARGDDAGMPNRVSAVASGLSGVAALLLARAEHG
jgi:hypothetical protein